jgi:hypothetical protein
MNKQVSYHSQIDALLVLESIQQPDQPFAFRRRQNIALRQDVPDLVELEQQLLAHHLQRAHLPRVLFLCQIHLPIAALTDLRENLKVSLPQSRAPLAKVCPLPSQILVEGIVVLGVRCRWWGRVLFIELGEAGLTCVHVGEQVVVVV